MATPTIQRRRLGAALKRAREQSGKTQDEAAERLDAAPSKISRLELGQSGVKQTDLTLLFDLYGVRGDHAEWMRDLARAGRQRGRWSSYNNSIPDWFRAYVDLESDASDIRWYQPEIVPGILQLESYIRAMTASAQPPANGMTDRHLAVRRERQSILTQHNAPKMRFILSESALLRNIGGPLVMRDQLRHLVTLSESRKIDIRVLPFNAPTIGAAWAGFTIMRFADDATSDVVYLEDYTDATYLDGPAAVRAYCDLWRRLHDATLDAVESRQMIASHAEAYHT